MGTGGGSWEMGSGGMSWEMKVRGGGGKWEVEATGGQRFALAVGSKHSITPGSRRLGSKPSFTLARDGFGRSMIETQLCITCVEAFVQLD